jgi:HEAT repeat protein
VLVGATFQPIPLEQAASTKELSQHLCDADPQIRARAIGGLAERDGNQARDSVMVVLRDSDPTVRTQALCGAENGGVDLPPDTLEDLARNDPAPEVRFLALDALQATPAGEAAAQRALQDANPHVREAASQCLQRLHAKQEPPATVTQPNPYSQ